MPDVEVDHRGSVAVVRLARGVTNAVSPELVGELADLLDRLRGDAGARALVLTSASDRFFSIGFDLPRLVPLPREEFAAFFSAFDRLCLDLLTFPKPVVAAVTGHATAAGCILALCCDYRYVAEGRKLMGLNEIKLGVPVPYLADRVLAHLVGHRAARDIIDSGDFYAPADQLALGLTDRVLPPDQVIAKALGKAETLGASPGSAFADIKRNRIEPLAAEILGRLEDRQRSFIESWYAAPARERLQEALAKFGPPAQR